jgi:hypothetical protein
LQWRYFCGPGQALAANRWSANGKGLAEQRLADVEVFCSDGKRRGNQREVLIKEEVGGGPSSNSAAGAARPGRTNNMSMKYRPRLAP